MTKSVERRPAHQMTDREALRDAWTKYLEVLELSGQGPLDRVTISNMKFGFDAGWRAAYEHARKEERDGKG